MSRDVQNRRSSLHNAQFQQVMNPQDIFRNMPPEYRLQNITRLSGNSQRGSGLQKRAGSGIPTPSKDNVRAKTGGPSSTSRNIAQAAAAAKQLPGSSRPLSASRMPRPSGRNPSVAFGTSGRSSSAQFRGPVGFRASANTTSSSFNSTRRKSKSSETLSLLQTPAFTPGTRSRSKSPGMSTARRRGGVINDTGGDQSKNIKITKDRKIHAQMAQCVYDFLETHQCQAKPNQWKDLMNPSTISNAKFVAMVKFVASHFVGDGFFAKGDDDAGKLMEIGNLLKYPGPLSKSHLKTATAQHAWPTCLTFLTWLCCRGRYLLTPPPERSTVFDLASNGFKEAVFESYLNLYPYYFNQQWTDEVVDEELIGFQERVREWHGSEVNKTKDELEKEKSEKLAELEHLNAEVDPTKEFKDRYQSELKLEATIVEKIREAENKCKQLSDFNHITIEQERLDLEITAKRQELKQLRNVVESQALNQKDAAKVRAETANLKIQIEALVSVNRQLKSDIKKRSEAAQKAEKNLYDLCKHFSMIERYNEIIRFLQLNEFVIPANPFSLEGLEDWMKNASKILRDSEGHVNNIMKNIVHNSDIKHKENMEFAEMLQRLRRDIEDQALKIAQLEDQLKSLESEHDAEYKQELDKEANAKDELQKEEYEASKVSRLIETWKTANAQWKERLDSFRKCVKEWENKLEKAVNDCLHQEAEAVLYLGNAAVELAKYPKQFYMEHYNVNILEEEEAPQPQPQ